MNIILKQGDIEKAVRHYVEKQGINLRNKTLGIVFNMGRGENGLSASLTIDDIDIPGSDAPAADHAGHITGTGAHKAAEQIKSAGNDMVQLTAATTPEPAPTAAVVDDVVEVPKTAPATLAEVAEAGLIPAVAEAKTDTAPEVVESAPAVSEAVAAEAAPVKATTSLFGS